MQTPFRGEDRIITFHTVVTMPFLVTASGKQADAAAMLLLWKPDCDGQQGGTQTGRTSNPLRPACSDCSPRADFMLYFAILLMVQWKANVGSNGLTAFGRVRLSFLCCVFKILLGVIGIIFLHLSYGL